MGIENIEFFISIGAAKSGMEKHMTDREKVILFGKGNVYRRKKSMLFQHYEIVLFLDNSIKPDQPVMDEETGVTIINPTLVSNYPAYPIILLSYALGDMCKQMLDLGVDKERLLFGTSMKPFNTFEKMLFGDGVGEIYLDGQEVLYQNQKHHLKLRTNPSNLETIIEDIKDTQLYPCCLVMLENMPLGPVDDTYGMNRGTPIDRYYIEKFLKEHQALIKGTVMEVGDRQYTLRYGKEKVQSSIVLDALKNNLEDNIICGDFVTGKGIQKESIDCLICTQTLPFIYDIHAAARNIVHLLKRGGTALITVGGISQIISYERAKFGHYWSFTDMSLRRLFEHLPDVKEIEVCTYGNVKTAASFLYGISYEEMKEEDLLCNDLDYQLIITAVVKKAK